MKQLFFLAIMLSYSTLSLAAQPFKTPDQFIQTLLPHAVEAGKKLGVHPNVILAQAALESNWGRSILKHKDQRPSYNIFSVKQAPSKNKSSVTIYAKEFRKGKIIREKSTFKSYPNFKAAFDDYTRIIQKPHYQKHMKKSKTPTEYAKSLQKAGYATDPKYAQKIMSHYRVISKKTSKIKAKTTQETK